MATLRHVFLSQALSISYPAREQPVSSCLAGRYNGVTASCALTSKSISTIQLPNIRITLAESTGEAKCRQVSLSAFASIRSAEQKLRDATSLFTSGSSYNTRSSAKQTRVQIARQGDFSTEDSHQSSSSGGNGAAGITRTAETPLSADAHSHVDSSRGLRESGQGKSATNLSNSAEGSAFEASIVEKLDTVSASVQGTQEQLRDLLNRSESRTTGDRSASSAEADGLLSSSREEMANEQITAEPSCPVPQFNLKLNSKNITLLQPIGLLPSDAGSESEEERRRKPLLIYVPGMDGTGQVIKPQIPYIVSAGYEVRCVYIPSSDRSTWQQLVEALVPLISQEASLAGPGAPGGSAGEGTRHVTLLAESFGAALALRIARFAPSLVSRMVLLTRLPASASSSSSSSSWAAAAAACLQVNSATGFSRNNPIVSFAAWTGLLAAFPMPLYEFAQDILLPLLVKRNRVPRVDGQEPLSPVDYVPAACAAWRFSMLNDDSGLENADLASIPTPTLILAAVKDRVLPSVAEGARLQRLLPNSRRVLLPEWGAGEGSWGLRKEAVPDEVMDEMGRILTSPLVSGEAHLPNPNAEPRRAVLFVGNHTLFGLYDAPLLIYELFTRGFRCRGLAHPGHWMSGVGQVMESCAAAACAKGWSEGFFCPLGTLHPEGENVLLFPGGAREVNKRKGEEYQLMWKEKADFVRMASRLGAIIVPFAALGGDDASREALVSWQRVMLCCSLRMLACKLTDSRKDWARAPCLRARWHLYESNGLRTEEVVAPITTLPGTSIPSLLPIPTSVERIYFHFAEPIDTTEYQTKINDPAKVRPALCSQSSRMVRRSVEDSLEYLKDVRVKDPERELSVRLLNKVTRLLPEFEPRKSSSSPISLQNANF
eukprot:jgi/Mesen1/8241/ME000443S07389